MKAVSVELVPREFSSVVFGVMAATSVMSIAPALASASPEMAVTAIGTSMSRSSRRRAVTMISLLSSMLAPGYSCAKAAGAKATRPSALVAQMLVRSDEHTSELQSLMRISYAVFRLNNQNYQNTTTLCQAHL